jgi:hypothetical protein
MKKLVIGLVIGLMLGMSTNAFAAIGDTVSAVFAQFNYVVDGTAKTIDSPVLVYEGVSYVRTTDISNMLGYDVTYKADSRTIEFNNPTAPAPSSTPTGSTTPTESPTPSASPDPNVPAPSPDPNASPAPEPSATPTPAPDPYNGQSNQKFLTCHPLIPGSMEYIMNDCGS